MTPPARELQISSDTGNLSRVRRVVLDLLAGSPFDPDQCNKIVLAVDEALANVVEHAYRGRLGQIYVGLDLDLSRLLVIIRDSGDRFDPCEVPGSSLDIHRHITDGLKGGLGLFLISEIMDEVRYRHEGEDFVNELVMVKRCPAVGGA